MDPVANLNLTRYEDDSNTTIYHYTWEAPFSLNISEIEPDVAYCVHIYIVTCSDQEIPIESNCNVTVTSYTIQTQPNELYRIEVRPRILYSVGPSSTTAVEYKGTIYIFIEQYDTKSIIIILYSWFIYTDRFPFFDDDAAVVYRIIFQTAQAVQILVRFSIQVI